MLSRLNNVTFGIGLHEVCVRKDRWAGIHCVVTKFSCFHRFSIDLSNGSLQRARERKFRCNSGVPNNFILLKVSLFLVPGACWAWRQQLEKE